MHFPSTVLHVLKRQWITEKWPIVNLIGEISRLKKIKATRRIGNGFIANILFLKKLKNVMLLLLPKNVT